MSINSPGNPWSQSGRRKRRLRWEGFAEKESFKPGVKEWRGNGSRKWWVDRTDEGSATQRTGWCRNGEISSAWLTEGSRELIPETRGSIYWKERSVIRSVEKMMWIWSSSSADLLHVPRANLIYTRSSRFPCICPQLFGTLFRPASVHPTHSIPGSFQCLLEANTLAFDSLTCRPT